MNATLRVALIGLALTMLLGASPETKIVVKGGATAMGETPIVAVLPPSFEAGAYTMKAGDEAIPATVLKEGKQTKLVAVVGRVPAGGEVVYTITPGSPGGVGIEVRPAGANIKVSLDGKPLTEYLIDAGPKPYYFPLIGPTGKPITRAFPMKDVAGEKRDHPHQRSLWFTHGKVNGVDFWSEVKGHGSIRETARAVIADGPAIGVIRTEDEWLDADGKVVCDDERRVRFYATKGARIIDVDIAIKATHGPVTFGDTKEGMFGIRVASSMDVDAKKGGKITNAEGLTDAAAWGKPSPWVDYTGPVDGEIVGIAILNHPHSFRFPTTWHVRTYGCHPHRVRSYGLFAANPFGWNDFGMNRSGEFTIPEGETIRFGYRVILHKGTNADAGLPAAFAAYADPPTVEVRTE